MPAVSPRRGCGPVDWSPSRNWLPPDCFPTGVRAHSSWRPRQAAGRWKPSTRSPGCRRRRSTVALTNTPGSAITQRCDTVVELHADQEVGGVACRSYQHTLALLLALESHLAGDDIGSLAGRIAAAATAARAPARHRGGLAPGSRRTRSGARRHPPRRARAPVLFRPAGCPDAPRGATSARGRLRDRGLEPRRRLSDEDHRLPATGVRGFGMGVATRRVDHAAGQHGRRRRR